MDEDVDLLPTEKRQKIIRENCSSEELKRMHAAHPDTIAAQNVLKIIRNNSSSGELNSTYGDQLNTVVAPLKPKPM